MQPVFNLFSDRHYRENLFLSSNYMGLGIGVRGGKNPPLPISSLGLPPPSLPPFPANFLSRPRGRFVIGQSSINSLLSKGKKRGQRVGKKRNLRPCAIFCEERGAGLQRQAVISRAGKEEFQPQLLPPPPRPFHCFVLSHEPRFRAMACAVQQHQP